MTGKHELGDTFLCSAMVRFRLSDAQAGKRSRRAVLEGISPATASLLTEKPVEEQVDIDLLCGRCSLRGKVRDCRFHPQLGYGVTVDFHPGSRWSEELYRPKHLTAPSRLKGCKCKGAAACAIRAAHTPDPELPLEERVRRAGSETAIVSPGMTESDLRRCFACFFGLPKKSPLFAGFCDSYRETARAVDENTAHEDSALVLARLAKVLGEDCAAC